MTSSEEYQIIRKKIEFITRAFGLTHEETWMSLHFKTVTSYSSSLSMGAHLEMDVLARIHKLYAIAKKVSPMMRKLEVFFAGEQGLSMLETLMEDEMDETEILAFEKMAKDPKFQKEPEDEIETA